MHLSSRPRVTYQESALTAGESLLSTIDRKRGLPIFPLWLFCHGSIPSHCLDEFEIALEAKSVNVRRNHVSVDYAPGSALASEDLIWVALVLYATKPFLSEILKQAGSDTYSCLKKALKELWGRLSRLEGERNSFPEFTFDVGKRPIHADYSRAFAIDTELGGGRKVRLLIRTGCSEEEFLEGVESLLGLLDAHFSGAPSQDLEIDFGDQEGWHGSTFVVGYNGKDRSLHVVDPLRYKRKA